MGLHPSRRKNGEKKVQKGKKKRVLQNEWNSWISVIRYGTTMNLLSFFIMAPLPADELPRTNGGLTVDPINES
jgi:hypothetical protein